MKVIRSCVLFAPEVPFSHAVRLHDALAAVNARHELVRVAGGDHGDFTLAQFHDAHERVLAFLRAIGCDAKNWLHSGAVFLTVSGTGYHFSPAPGRFRRPENQ